jgi:hypothetical protein
MRPSIIALIKSRVFAEVATKKCGIIARSEPPDSIFYAGMSPDPGEVCGDPENKGFGRVPDRSRLAYRIVLTSDSVDRFLFVTVPPTGVQVTDDLNVVKNGITTAYAEGASLTLTCTATGGKPLAKVSRIFLNCSHKNIFAPPKISGNIEILIYS